MTKDHFGVWEITVKPLADGNIAIPHGSRIKISMITPEGARIERIPAWIKRVEQDRCGGSVLDGIFWHQSTPYQWRYSAPPTPATLRIYEVHIGICTAQPKVTIWCIFSRYLT